jgi:hypothetical protein
MYLKMMWQQAWLGRRRRRLLDLRHGLRQQWFWHVHHHWLLLLLLLLLRLHSVLLLVTAGHMVGRVHELCVELNKALNHGCLALQVDRQHLVFLQQLVTLCDSGC